MSLKDTVRNRFSTPGRAVATVAVAVAALAVLAIGGAFAVRAVAKANSIGERAALARAYSDAGVAEGEVDYARADFGFDDGSFVYEVEFGTRQGEFEYVLLASDGAILERDMPDGWYEGAGRDSSAATPGGASKAPGDDAAGSGGAGADASGQGSGAAAEATISSDEALRIALDHAGVAEQDATVTKNSLDRDDGYLTYEVEFVSGATEWEYEIDATDGTVLSFDAESVHD